MCLITTVSGGGGTDFRTFTSSQKVLHDRTNSKTTAYNRQLASWIHLIMRRWSRGSVCVGGWQAACKGPSVDVIVQNNPELFDFYFITLLCNEVNETQRDQISCQREHDRLVREPVSSHFWTSAVSTFLHGFLWHNTDWKPSALLGHTEHRRRNWLI